MNDQANLPIYDSSSLRIPFIYEFYELIRYRYLLQTLISRDLKVRYKRSFLGIIWAMVNPLLTMLVMIIVFSQLFRFNIENYPIYLLAGILLWRLFSEGTTTAINSVYRNRGMTKKIYIPSSIFVVAAIGSALINMLFAMIPLLVLAIMFGVKPEISWLYLPIPIGLATSFALGIGLIIASFAVFFADMINIYAVLLSAFYFLTPIFYPIEVLPDFLIKLEQFNPMYQSINAFRSVLMEGTLPPFQGLLIALIEIFLFIVLGWTIFTKLTDKFAYRV